MWKLCVDLVLWRTGNSDCISVLNKNVSQTPFKTFEIVGTESERGGEVIEIAEEVLGYERSDEDMEYDWSDDLV